MRQGGRGQEAAYHEQVLLGKQVLEQAQEIGGDGDASSGPTWQQQQKRQQCRQPSLLLNVG